MSNKRVKSKTVPMPKTRAEAEAIASNIARNQLRAEQIAAHRDTEVLHINEGYTPMLAIIKEDVDEDMESLKMWCLANPGEFGDKKSIETIDCTFGFRTGNFALKLLHNCTWETVKSAIISLSMFDFLRSKTDVNKEAILAKRDDPAVDISRLGVQAIQVETFYVDPKTGQPAAAELKIKT